MNAVDKIKQKFGSIVEILTHHPRRHYIKVAPENLRPVVHYIFKELGGRLCTSTAVDTRAGFEVLHHLAIDAEGLVCTVKVLAARENPEIDSISDFLPGAAWIELEMNELMGVNFKGNPRIRHFLLADNYPEEIFPLRKNQVTEQT